MAQFIYYYIFLNAQRWRNILERDKFWLLPSSGGFCLRGPRRRLWAGQSMLMVRCMLFCVVAPLTHCKALMKPRGTFRTRNCPWATSCSHTNTHLLLVNKYSLKCIANYYPQQINKQHISSWFWIDQSVHR